jgi:CHAT domain-containing protein/tetratricopeptide (TPR) repeat protein
VRPALSRVLEDIYLIGKAQLASGDIETAVLTWRSLVDSLGGQGCGDLKAWINLRIGKAWGEKREWGKAAEIYEILEAAESPRAQVAAWEALGETHERQNEYQLAEKAYSSALEIRQKLKPQSLGGAVDLNHLGETAGDTGNLNLAHDHFHRALELSEHFAPQSLLVAKALNNLGVEVRLRGVLDRAQDLFLRALAIRKNLAPLSEDTAESLNNLGNIALARADYDAAYTYLLQALEIRQNLAPGSLYEANSLNNLGVLLSDRGQLDLAQDYHSRALQIREQIAPQSLDLATSLNNMGLVSKARGELDHARVYFSRALEIRQRIAPKSLATVHSLISLGEVDWSRGDFDRAEEYFVRALEICKQIAPQSLDEATSLNDLGVLAAQRGDLALASSHFFRAFQLQKILAPHSLDLARSLENLGAVDLERGEIDRAYDYDYQALQIQENLAPSSLTVASTLSNISAVMRARGQLDRAYDYQHRAVQIQERLAPNSLDMASSLNKLGVLAYDRGELARAYGYYHRSLNILRKLAPRSLDLASIHNNLGSLSQLQGRPDDALEYYHQALNIKEPLISRSISVSETLSNLGALALSSGDLGQASSYYYQAIKITEPLAYQSLDYIVSLHGLGLIAQARGDMASTYDYFSRVIDGLEHQISKLGGSYDVQASFRSRRAEYYQDLLNLLLTQSRPSEAFHVLERFRAQTFLAMLAERDTAFTVDIPEGLDRERRRLGVLSDRTLKKLAGLNPRDNGEEIEATRRELRKLDDEAGDVEARIRQASPRLAALKYPHPLDAAETQKALDPGTLLLSYRVGKEKTALFVLSRSVPLEVKTLPLGEEALRSQVKQLLGLIHEAVQDSSVGKLRQRRVQAASHKLYAALLGPVAERIAASERLLILPDGPLHVLPFAALVRDIGAEGAASSGQYLAEWKPIHIALSATVFAELKQRRRSASESQTPFQLAAFGDPVYPQSLTKPKGVSEAALPAATGVIAQADVPRGDPTVRSAAERGIFDWPPLPYTRHEVEGIASLFPPGTAHTFLGPEALEERVKSLDPKTRILHLAAHGYTDEHLPSSSFIALTIPEDTKPDAAGPGRDNGLLQVWEIFERVRLDADLVVLSACDTGLGEEQGGEGLIGLTRAFQYAGARSVMASLWSVRDQATSELMIRFYKHLLAGLPKDEALRQAQIELIRGPIEVVNEKREKVLLDASAPYFWAGFQVYGDWQ